VHQAAAEQGKSLRALDERMALMQQEVAALRVERDKLAEIEAERERGTAKGRTFEEEVAAAIDAIAGVQGDDSEAVGDLAGATGKTGDVVVGIEGCSGPPRGRIVFEAKNSKKSRPDALRELDRALEQRDADFAVLVVPSEDKVPAKMRPLREYNGDKLIVAFDPEADGTIALELAYSLARARVLMQRSESEGIDASAVHDTVERALNAMEMVRTIKSTLKGATTNIEKARVAIDAMAAQVRAHLEHVDELVRAGDSGDGDGEDAPDGTPEPEPQRTLV
jgi:DNA repair ATPase RecN